MNRRVLLKSIVGSGLALLGGVVAFECYQQATLDYSEESADDDYVTLFLTPDDRLILSVFIPIMVGQIDIMPNIKVSMLNIDNAIIKLPLKTQQELRDLFDLLGSGVGRLLIAGVWLNWQKAGSNEILAFLSGWRESQLNLLQQAYIGLHKLIIASVYAESEHWNAIGYPGPLKLSR